AELLKQLGRNRRQSRRLGFRFARHKFSLGACYALNTKFLTGPACVTYPVLERKTRRALIDCTR
ncbi:hypothetical protein, partial [Burkholderia orbicola]|uniref:hypothetical protein n=1 Tax=Burkholderia orbicola TaxID=2978683 RepID=UPI002652247E